MEYKGLKFGTLVSILVIVLAIYYRKSENTLQKRLIAVLEGLERVETKHEGLPRPKVAIGYGICTDVYIDAKYLLKYSNDIRIPEHFDEITTEKELLKSFAYYFRHGAAAEFVKEGCDVLLAAKMTKALQQMIPSNIRVVGGDVNRDDVHLVLEYKRGESWGPYTSSRANRYIVHNDINNPTISSLEEFDKLLPEFAPDLFVVSGLQMMDNYPFPEGVRLSRLLKVKQQMIAQPKSTKIHFEMASFTEESLLLELTELVIPFADSLGMNEQEVTNLHNLMLYGNISLVADSNPRVATVLDQMRTLFKLVRRNEKSFMNARQLTRIHVHTLAYQAILNVKNSRWKNTMAAAAKASLTANRHVCGSNNVDVQKAMLIMDDSFSTSTEAGKRIPLDIEKPVSCWDEVLKIENDQISVQVCVAPVLVCTQASQTAGGGDNISSAGLVPQIS
ncbi:ADP-dependent glucokinase isoform X2 [Neodiprion pinetum]|uniref:ADP-dependent glucokinase isoform X2 n=1 Tax=Neodiprion lecontei TaxID=441921 RepID=A0ABM3GEB5_NEOLC|nr:ADP-dependent glucokinase isoform X2 [Neodiprion pinetum]XP_046598610.1 ADP-dependent glucokinase isoform X2 [Neodiprion lecontei]